MPFIGDVWPLAVGIWGLLEGSWRVEVGTRNDSVRYPSIWWQQGIPSAVGCEGFYGHHCGGCGLQQSRYETYIATCFRG